MPNDVLAVCPFFKSTYVNQRSSYRVLRCAVFDYDYVNTELRTDFIDREILNTHLDTFCKSHERYPLCPYYKIIKGLVL